MEVHVIDQMPIPLRDFNGKAIITYGSCSWPGSYTEKDVDEVDIYDYCNYCNMDTDANDIEVVECKISSDIIEIDDKCFRYIEKDDIFILFRY